MHMEMEKRKQNTVWAGIQGATLAYTRGLNSPKWIFFLLWITPLKAGLPHVMGKLRQYLQNNFKANLKLKEVVCMNPDWMTLFWSFLCILPKEHHNCSLIQNSLQNVYTQSMVVSYFSEKAIGVFQKTTIFHQMVANKGIHQMDANKLQNLELKRHNISKQNRTHWKVLEITTYTHT